MADNEKPSTDNAWEESKWFAKFFGLSEERIRQLADAGIMPKKKVKGVYYYPTITTIRNYIKYLQEIVGNRKKTSEEQEREKLEADIAFKRAKAKLAELELRTLEAKLLRAEDVKIFVEDLAATIKSELSALPGRMAMDIANLQTTAEVSETLSDEINEVLNRLADYEFDLDFYKKRIAEDKGKESVFDGEDD